MFVQGLGVQLEMQVPLIQASFEPGQVPDGFDELHWVVVQGGRWHIPPVRSLFSLLQIVPWKQSPFDMHVFCTQ
jgi:hypothetical protein